MCSLVGRRRRKTDPVEREKERGEPTSNDEMHVSSRSIRVDDRIDPRESKRFDPWVRWKERRG